MICPVDIVMGSMDFLASADLLASGPLVISGPYGISEPLGIGGRLGNGASGGRIYGPAILVKKCDLDVGGQSSFVLDADLVVHRVKCF